MNERNEGKQNEGNKDKRLEMEGNDQKQRKTNRNEKR